MTTRQAYPVGDANNCNVSSASQMSSSVSVFTAPENASRLGFKHVCVNYLYVASHDYQEVIQHTDTHTHIHTLTHSQNRSIFSRSTPTSLSTPFQVPNIIESKTHPHAHSLTKSFYFSRSTPTSLSTPVQVENESSKYY